MPVTDPRPLDARPTADSGVRLADLVGAFSLATDLGLGQPMDHVLRSWRIAAALGEHVGVEADERAALYYVVTLAWVGCVADTIDSLDLLCSGFRPDRVTERT